MVVTCALVQGRVVEATPSGRVLGCWPSFGSHAHKPTILLRICGWCALV